MVNALLLVSFICVPRDLSGVIVVEPPPTPVVILEMGLRQSWGIGMFIITDIFSTNSSFKYKASARMIS